MIARHPRSYEREGFGKTLTKIPGLKRNRTGH